MNNILLACKYITDKARHELRRAGTIHTNIPGLVDSIELVAIPYDSLEDLHMMSVWDVPREIDVKSRYLHFFYNYVESISGYCLSAGSDDEVDLETLIRRETAPPAETNDDDLGDLEDHPF